MANDLLAELVKVLRRIWRNTPGMDAPETSEVPEQVARSIIEQYGANGEATQDDPTGKDDSGGGLPLLARLWPRGIFEDDWLARPSKDKPWPVILIHGTGTTKGSWQELGADLRRDGWAVFAPDFGHRATGELAESVAQIGAYIDAVIKVTGAEKVILVGHSQGGALARAWMRFSGGYLKVKHLVSITAPNHGTTMGGIAGQVLKTPIAESAMQSLISTWFGGSGFELIAGSEFIEDLNAKGDLDPGVTYTCIATHFDVVIQPPESCFLYGDRLADKDRVRNLWIDDIDPAAVIPHEQMPHDRRVRRVIRSELQRVADGVFTVE